MTDTPSDTPAEPPAGLRLHRMPDDLDGLDEGLIVAVILGLGGGHPTVLGVAREVTKWLTRVATSQVDSPMGDAETAAQIAAVRYAQSHIEAMEGDDGLIGALAKGYHDGMLAAVAIGGLSVTVEGAPPEVTADGVLDRVRVGENWFLRENRDYDLAYARESIVAHRYFDANPTTAAPEMDEMDVEALADALRQKPPGATWEDLARSLMATGLVTVAR